MQTSCSSLILGTPQHPCVASSCSEQRPCHDAASKVSHGSAAATASPPKQVASNMANMFIQGLQGGWSAQGATSYLKVSATCKASGAVGMSRLQLKLPAFAQDV